MTYSQYSSYIGAGALSGNAAAITPALPAGIATGNLLLAAFETDNQAISIATQNGGNWAEVANSPQGIGTPGDATATRLTLFEDVYNGSQTAPVSSDSGDHNIGRIGAFSCNATTPYNVIGYGTQDTDSAATRILAYSTSAAVTIDLVNGSNPGWSYFVLLGANSYHRIGSGVAITGSESFTATHRTAVTVAVT